VEDSNPIVTINTAKVVAQIPKEDCNGSQLNKERVPRSVKLPYPAPDNVVKKITENAGCIKLSLT
tara:strand:- start:2292 stop:2486 length:195 start_codon:yes stop_codon:yes gene_type:complete